MPDSNFIKLQIPQSSVIHTFEVGDIVRPTWIKDETFYGIIVEVDPSITKVYVDYNGTVIQHDPYDVRVVPEQIVNESVPVRLKSQTAVAKRIAKKLVSSMMKEVFQGIIDTAMSMTEKGSAKFDDVKKAIKDAGITVGEEDIINAFDIDGTLEVVNDTVKRI